MPCHMKKMVIRLSGAVSLFLPPVPSYGFVGLHFLLPTSSQYMLY
uniref:Uncharacterized protein n=1 Tax=Arundo donax TaxID=35708 RepID=A0A0A9D9A0_ARUDO